MGTFSWLHICRFTLKELNTSSITGYMVCFVCLCFHVFCVFVADEPLKKPIPLHEQTVKDEKGRYKRFHGAFTGGFSAGYFNTVGSKEGQCRCITSPAQLSVNKRSGSMSDQCSAFPSLWQIEYSLDYIGINMYLLGNRSHVVLCLWHSLNFFMFQFVSVRSFSSNHIYFQTQLSIFVCVCF